MSKRYNVSRQLDVEIDYFITKTKNRIYKLLTYGGSAEELDELELRLDKLERAMGNILPTGTGVWTVEAEHFATARKCRDEYRAVH